MAKICARKVRADAALLTPEKFLMRFDYFRQPFPLVCDFLRFPQSHGGSSNDGILLEADFRRMFLTQTLEFVERYAHLPEDLEKQRRPNFAASVDRNRHGAPVWVIPSFVASRLSRLKEA